MYLAGRIEARRCNYEAAIDHFKEAHSYVDIRRSYSWVNMKEGRLEYYVDLGVALLKQSADNEAEAFELFQTELDECQEPIERENILIRMGVEYRNLKKCKQSIETLQLCPSDTPCNEKSMISSSTAHKAMAQTYLEQYCADNTLDIDQRRDILKLATAYSQDDVETTVDMHLTHAQIFYYNGNRSQAYTHLKQYLDVRLTECKVGCYTCKQRVQEQHTPLKCASCKAVWYCDKRHQRLTWQDERICHKVICPLLRYWRRVKAGKAGETRCDEAFSSFFESIYPHLKTFATRMPTYVDGMNIVD